MVLEVPEDFIYDITPTPYGMSLSVTIGKSDRDENEDFLLKWGLCDDPWDFDVLCPSVWTEIDQTHF